MTPPNEPLLVTPTCTLIFRALNPDWPYLVKRRTDGKSIECSEARSAVLWMEGVSSVAELSRPVRQFLKAWESTA